MPTTPPIADYRAIAVAEEGRVARSVADIADESRPFAGGAMIRGEPGAWLNYAVGAGLARPVERDEVRAMIEWYEGAGVEPRIEVCPFVDLSLLRALAAERFVPRRFETVFYRPLDRAERIESPFAAPDGLRIEIVDPNDAAAAESFARTALHGFLPEGTSDPPASLLESSLRVTRHPRCTALRAMIGDECVGAGAMEVLGDVAALFGVSVRPPHRRKGVQQALIAWRIAAAAEAGAKFATIASLPGIATERNAQRSGFGVAYSKLSLVRPGEGLVPALE